MNNVKKEEKNQKNMPQIVYGDYICWGKAWHYLYLCTNVPKIEASIFLSKNSF